MMPESERGGAVREMQGASGRVTAAPPAISAVIAGNGISESRNAQAPDLARLFGKRKDPQLALRARKLNVLSAI
jgi:hypothetical protein